MQKSFFQQFKQGSISSTNYFSLTESLKEVKKHFETFYFFIFFHSITLFCSFFIFFLFHFLDHGKYYFILFYFFFCLGFINFLFFSEFSTKFISTFAVVSFYTSQFLILLFLLFIFIFISTVIFVFVFVFVFISSGLERRKNSKNR